MSYTWTPLLSPHFDTCRCVYHQELALSVIPLFRHLTILKVPFFGEVTYNQPGSQDRIRTCYHSYDRVRIPTRHLTVVQRTGFEPVIFTVKG